MFLLWQAPLRAEREGNNCLTTAKILLFSETHNYFTCFFAFLQRNMRARKLTYIFKTPNSLFHHNLASAAVAHLNDSQPLYMAFGFHPANCIAGFLNGRGF